MAFGRLILQESKVFGCYQAHSSGSAAVLGRQGTQKIDLRRGVVGLVDGRSRNEVVSSRLGRFLDRRAGDSAVDLDPHVQARRLDGSARARNLRHHLLDEGLASEAGFHRHDQDHVELAEDVQVGLDPRGRAQRQARAPAHRPDLAGEADRRLGRLGVEGDGLASKLGVDGRPAVRVLDHEMGVDGDRTGLHGRLGQRQAEGEVWDEVIVHDVHVREVRIRDFGKLVGEMPEIAVENRR